MNFKKKKIQGIIWDDEFNDKHQNSIWKDLTEEFESYNITTLGFSEPTAFKRYLDDKTKSIDFIILDIVNKMENEGNNFGYTLARDCRAIFKKPIFFITGEKSQLQNPQFNLRQPFSLFYKGSNYKNIAYSIYSFLAREGLTQSKIFIGHGRREDWKKLKTFIEDKFQIECDEYNSFATEGLTTIDRIMDMKVSAGLAFIIMTAEDENIHGEVQARQNVVHEIGLFQGYLGFEKVIIVREESCTLFSNIGGVTYLPFKDKNIESCFDSIERILQREKFVN